MSKRILAALALLLVAATVAWYAWPAQVKPLLASAHRASAGLAAQSVLAAGHQLHYLEGGQGEPLVLLHGIFAEKDHWVDFARPLTAHWRVIAPDLPGFGESGRHAGAAYDYASQVARLKDVLDALGLQRVHLAGNSMGGTIAVLFAQAHPDRVASVAMIGAPHGVRTPRASTMDRLIHAGQAPLVPRDAQAFEAMLDLVFARRPFLPFPVYQVARETALRDAGSNLRLWHEQLADRFLLDARIGALAQPALVLWGEQDRVFDVSGAAVVSQRLPAARVERMEGVGHLPMMEAPADSARRYQAFLRGLPASGATVPHGRPAP